MASLSLFSISHLYGGIDILQDSTSKADSIPYESTHRPSYEPSFRFGDLYSDPPSKSSINLTDPTKVVLQVAFDSAVNYTIEEKIEGTDFRPPVNFSFQEYDAYNTCELIRDYWREQSVGLEGESAIGGRRLIPKLYISPVFDRILVEAMWILSPADLLI